jgi:hypothetical protein
MLRRATSLDEHISGFRSRRELDEQLLNNHPEAAAAVRSCGGCGDCGGCAELRRLRRLAMDDAPASAVAEPPPHEGPRRKRRAVDGGGAAAAAAGGDLVLLCCAACKASKPSDQFSKTQRGKAPGVARCSDCIGAEASLRRAGGAEPGAGAIELDGSCRGPAGPLGPSSDRESSTGNAPALVVPGPLAPL